MLSVTASVVNRWLATKQIGTHYDVGNEFFQRWLDPSMTYSCAYFQSTEDDLQKAQLQKLELVCQKACLQKGHHILDIGCGWGSLVAHAAVNHGVTAMGVTLSREQQEFATLAVRGIPGVSIELRDWRQVKGRFDRIVSIGMLEHLGGAQYAAFFRRWQQLLSLHGMGVVHFIGRSRAAPDSRWIRQHIFPGGYLPTLAEVVSCVSDAGFVVVDVENLWQHYIRTLACWTEQFGNQQEWIVRQFDARFYRAWWLYLKGSQAAFQCGDLQLFQVVIAKGKPKAWPLQRQIFSGSVSTSSTV
jgi:cyclopropane-fatty-acyl-phospholipid synthase